MILKSNKIPDLKHTKVKISVLMIFKAYNLFRFFQQLCISLNKKKKRKERIIVFFIVGLIAVTKDAIMGRHLEISLLFVVLMCLIKVVFLLAL